MTTTINPHSDKIVVRDYEGYSIYCCARCGKNINSPGCLVTEEEK